MLTQFVNQKSWFLIIILGFVFLSCSEDSPTSTNGENGPGNNGNNNGEITGDVTVYLTSGNRLTLNDRQNPVSFSDDETELVIQVDADERMQTITGFGAAMTGSSAYLIRKMDDESRRDLLIDLFDPVEGIGISNIRLTIGSSDFSLGNYTYCDEPGLENFRIPEIDLRDVIPVMQEVMEINPDLWIMASPWSAPAWMKNNNSLNGGRLEEAHFGDFSRYLKRFVQAYEEEGIPIHAITVQNEPLHETGGYPTMYMPWQDQNKLIREHLGPLFEQENISAEIIIYDHNWDNYQYPIHILDDEVTRQYIAGSAFHGYGGDVGQMSLVHDAHPDKNLYFTEISGGGWATDFWDNITWNMDHIFLGSMRNQSKNALFWNLVLDDQDGPKNGGCQNCRGVVTLPENSSHVTRNEEYYILAHVARHVRPGDHRIHSTPPHSQLNYMAFVNEEDEYKLVMVNRSAEARTFQVRSEAGNFRYTLAGRTMGTFLWK